MAGHISGVIGLCFFCQFPWLICILPFLFAVHAEEGDAYPVGSLAVGTVINSLEVLPGSGSLMARAAGVQATILRRSGDKMTVIGLPSKREVAVYNTCMATVGRVCNINHNKRVIGKAGRNRWLGIRPRSGKYMKKTGRFGRKTKSVKMLKSYTTAKQKKSPMRPLAKAFHSKDIKQVYT